AALEPQALLVALELVDRLGRKPEPPGEGREELGEAGEGGIGLATTTTQQMFEAALHQLRSEQHLEPVERGSRKAAVDEGAGKPKELLAPLLNRRWAHWAAEIAVEVNARQGGQVGLDLGAHAVGKGGQGE